MRPLVLAVTISFLAVAMAGCFWFDAHCGPYYEDAGWTQPGLFDAMAGVEGVQEERPSGFAFSHPLADEEWGPHYVVQHISLEEGEIGGRDQLRVMLHSVAPGDHRRGASADVNGTIVTVSGTADHSDDTWRDLIERFVNVTDVAGDRRDAWITDLMASRAKYGEAFYPGNLDEAVVLLSGSQAVQNEPSPAEIAALLGQPDNGSMTGHRSRQIVWSTDNGTWTFQLRPFTRTLQIDSTKEGETERLAVTADDHVAVTVQQDVGGHPETVQAWLRSRFQEHGLPEPGFEGFEIQGSIC